jgi:cyclophilin family peptidyl-prolyl cis-trans isomerase
MPHCGKNTWIRWLGVMLLAALVGCGKGGDSSQTPAASIAGQGGATPPASGVKGQPGQKNGSDPLHPVVVIDTSLGKMTVQLDAEKAQLTVDNFLNYVATGHYDQTIVHQVFKGHGFIAGGYAVNGTNVIEKSTRTPVRNEAHNGLKNLRGTISMVRFPDAIDSARCQFFINVSDNPSLDFKERTPEGYGYCVFGKIVDGMDVVDRIGSAEVTDTKDFERTPAQAIAVKTIQRIR